jgi:23S rRNA (cytidine1920-2'-O)/16S rRNA (cytidine1409-2'-O)-methyltransferase
LRADTVVAVADAAHRLGWGAHGVCTSPLPGPSGNVEFFVWLRRGEESLTEDDLRAEVERAPGEPGERVDP